jgi:Spy/CpxP family protein refolding chaperone
MLPRTVAAVATLLALPTLPAAAQEHHPGYGEGQSTQVKTLTQAQVDELLAGAGMGMALPAELNGFPGPRHLLELADSLDLTAEQRGTVQDIFDRMQREARALGAKVVEAEKALDDLFAGGAVTQEALVERMEKSETLRAELRRVHLAAHLETRPLLTLHQIHTYDRLRGYGGSHVH